MDDLEQARAYHEADFSEPHGKRVGLFRERVPTTHLTGTVLDLGCGSGDIVFRFADAFPGFRFIGVDGSKAMIQVGSEDLSKRPSVSDRIQFVEAFIASDSVPVNSYTVIMSHSLLHHLHDPAVLWETVSNLASPETFIFVADLRRPQTREEAKQIVDNLASDEPEILQRDFYNSLCASFTAAEISEQISKAGLSNLVVEETGEIHVLIYGMAR